MLVDYLSIVSHPIDLSVIKVKLDRKKYKSLAEFNEDLMLMFHNSFSYNLDDSDPFQVFSNDHHTFSNKLFNPYFVIFPLLPFCITVCGADAVRLAFESEEYQ
jgi:hypothetical protein